MKFEMFLTVYDIPFHYAYPVTGRTWKSARKMLKPTEHHRGNRDRQGMNFAVNLSKLPSIPAGLDIRA